jgi:hypothetical protein
VSLLMGHPHSMNIVGQAWVTFIGFAVLNGAYISFKVAMTGLDPDTPTTIHPNDEGSNGRLRHLGSGFGLGRVVDLELRSIRSRRARRAYRPPLLACRWYPQVVSIGSADVQVIQ